MLLPFFMFLVGAAMVMGAYAVLVWLPKRRAEKRIERRIAEVSTMEWDRTAEQVASAPLVVKQHAVGVVPPLDAVVAETAFGSWSEALVAQAGLKIGLSTLLLACLGSAVAGAIGVSALLRLDAAAIPGAIVGAALPYLLIMRRRSLRMRRFEEQFPEALDLLSRAIRAGHAFTTAVGMVADEAPDPIGPEFRKTFDEQNFGMPLKDALTNLAARVPLMDVHFFVTAVLIQRETGGNLAEILDNLAHVVRERFKILRQVRVYTAHGRLTGYVLLALPAALAVALSFINPSHMDLLLHERLGKMMLVGAIVMQLIGYVWIRKVIKIEV
ncbi:MAG TPA: type II secretion system F family protein [Vicinamibacterales bacterium]|nr:type II secretion system F family protein [Vicinamibacterales bacterium]